MGTQPRLIEYPKPRQRGWRRREDTSPYQCRMVSLCNRWRNIHCADTDASIVCVHTVKFLFAVASAEDMEIFGTDIMEAFLTTQVIKARPKRSVLDPEPPDQT